MYRNQFPIEPKVDNFKPGRYRRIKVWRIKSTFGEHCIYAITAEEARNEFKRLKPTAVIISTTRIK